MSLPSKKKILEKDIKQQERNFNFKFLYWNTCRKYEVSCGDALYISFLFFIISGYLFWWLKFKEKEGLKYVFC